MSRTLAVALSLLCLAPLPAHAAMGDVGIELAGARQGGVGPALSLRGGWYLGNGGMTPVQIEALIGRSIGSRATTTTVMAGATLLLPMPAEDERDGPAWTLTALLGSGRVEDRDGDGRSLAWRVGGGMRWFRERTVLRVEAGYEGIALRDAPLRAPFIAAGVAWRIGE